MPLWGRPLNTIVQPLISLDVLSLSCIINFPLYWIFPISIQMSCYFSYIVRTKAKTKTCLDPISLPATTLFLVTAKLRQRADDAISKTFFPCTLKNPFYRTTQVLLSRSPMTTMWLNSMVHFSLDQLVGWQFIIIYYDVDFLKKILFIYSWETQRERQRDTGRGRRGSMQGAWRGTWSGDSRIMPWAEGRR